MKPPFHLSSYPLSSHIIALLRILSLNQMILLLVVLVLFFSLLDRKELDRQDCYMYLSQFHGHNDSKSNNTYSLVTKYIANRSVGRQQQIPYHIFQTNERDETPWKMNYAMHSVIEKNPQYTYRYLNATERRSFIKDHYDKEILDCYDKLNANAFKADLFRLLIVYAYGGCYIDNPFVATDALGSAFGPEITFFTSLDGDKGDYFMNAAFFCSVPGHPILKLTLERIVKSIAGEVYELDALNITGPRKLASGFKDYLNLTEIEGGGYYDDGKILVLERRFGVKCNMYLIVKENEEVLILSRYPDYLRNMEDYTNLPHYHVYFDEKTVYKKEIVIKVEKNYTMGSSERYRKRGQDYVVPREYGKRK